MNMSSPVAAKSHTRVGFTRGNSGSGVSMTRKRTTNKGMNPNC